MEPSIVTNAVQAGQTQSVRNANEAETGALVTSDFETFLVMLTTQLENQDPLNPMESQHLTGTQCQDSNLVVILSGRSECKKNSPTLDAKH